MKSTGPNATTKSKLQYLLKEKNLLKYCYAGFFLLFVFYYKTTDQSKEHKKTFQ